MAGRLTDARRRLTQRCAEASPLSGSTLAPAAMQQQACAEAAAEAGLGSSAATQKGRVIIITGPTAVGKTAVALRLAECLGGEVISADSVQLYKGLDIGSDKARIIILVMPSCSWNSDDLA